MNSCVCIHALHCSLWGGVCFLPRASWAGRSSLSTAGGGGSWANQTRAQHHTMYHVIRYTTLHDTRLHHTTVHYTTLHYTWYGVLLLVVSRLARSCTINRLDLGYDPMWWVYKQHFMTYCAPHSLHYTALAHSIHHVRASGELPGTGGPALSKG